MAWVGARPEPNDRTAARRADVINELARSLSTADV